MWSDFFFQLGLSFTIPFLSIPMSSLLNIGETTSTALSNMMSVNWPSILAVGVMLAAAAFLLPTVVEWVSGALLVHNAAGNQFGNQYGAPFTPFGRDQDPGGYSAPDTVGGFGPAPGYYSRSINSENI